MAANNVQIIISALDQSAPAFNTANAKLKEISTEVDRLKAGFTAAASAFSGLLATSSLFAIGNAIKDAVSAAEQYANTLRGLASVARYAGADIGQTIKAAADLSASGLISTGEAAGGLKNLLSAGLGLDKAVELMRRLTEQAIFNRQSHYDLGAAVVATTEGIKNENSVLSDATGTTKNLSVMYKEWAQEHKKAVEQMSAAEKVLAAYLGFLKETEASLGNAALATDTLTGAKGRLSKAMEGLTNAVGSGLNPAYMTLVDWLAQVVGYATSATKWIEILNATLNNFFDQSAKFANLSLLDMVNGRWPDVSKEQETFNKDMDSIMQRYSGKPAPPEIGGDSGKRSQTDAEKEAAANLNRFLEGNEADAILISNEGLANAAKAKENAAKVADRAAAKYADHIAQKAAKMIDLAVVNEDWTENDMARKSKAAIAAGNDTPKDFWQIQAEDKWEVLSRGYAAMEELKGQVEEVSEVWKSAFHGMQQASSTFFFDLIEGRMQSFGNNFATMVKRMAADWLSANFVNGLVGGNIRAACPPRA